MEKSAEKNVLLLVLAGAVLILANVGIVLSVRNGQIAPVDNLALWGAFAILNICSLLWAVTLLGLQPMVVAVSYVAGGLLAFQGVRMTPGVNMAEIATAGATYSAFGALLAGNATTRVRLAFFAKRQVPFVFIILSLLVVDGFLNSRISKSDWHIITAAAIYPFFFSGVVVGLVWMLLMRVRAEKPVSRKVNAAAEEHSVAADEPEHDEPAQLVISVPEHEEGEFAEETEEFAAVPDPMEEEPAQDTVPETVAVELESEPEEDSDSDTFFPLEIDADDEEAPLEENRDLLGVAAMIRDHVPEKPIVSALVVENAPEESLESALVVENVPEEPADKGDLEEQKADAGDWLNSHLDLLNKLK